MLVLNYKYVILEWLGLYFLNEYFVQNGRVMYDGEWKFGSFVKGKLFTEVQNKIYKNQ